MDTPDPVDALKYALTIVVTRLDALEGLEDVIDAVEAVASPFTDGQTLDDLRYSDGRPVTVTTEYEPGRAFATHFRPPRLPDQHRVHSMSRPRTRVRARVLGHARDQAEHDGWAAMLRDVRALVARIDRGETTATPSRLRCLRALAATTPPRPSEASVVQHMNATPARGRASC